MIILITLSFIAGILYRMGGTNLGTKWRDCGVPAICCGYLWHTQGFHWALILTYGLMWAALTSYEYFLPDKSDKTWVNYGLHGFFIALSLLPFVWARGLWGGFGLYCVLLPAAIAAWSHWVSEVNLEEGGRGAFILLLLSCFSLFNKNL